MIKVAIAGAAGRMGRTLVEAVTRSDAAVEVAAASVLAVAISMWSGINTSLLVAMACYALLIIPARRLSLGVATRRV